MLHETFGLGTGDEDFAHVADVEDTAGLAHCHMLVSDVGVLDRHFKASERYHLGLQRKVALIETGSLVAHNFWIIVFRFLGN